MRIKTHLMLAALFIQAAGAWAQTALPYQEAFDTKSGFEQFTTIDADADGQTWSYDDFVGEVKSSYDDWSSADNWLITPMFGLQKGVEYTLTFEAHSEFSGSTETFDVMLGTESTVEGMQTALLKSNSVTQTSPAVKFEKTFTVDTDGNYYIGFHHNTKDEMFGNSLCLDNITLSADNKETTTAVPSAVTDLRLEFDYDTNRATLTWKAPTTTTDGKPLDASELTYTIRRVGFSTPIEQNFPGTKYHENITLKDLPSSKVFFNQGLACYSVVAHSTNGDSEKAVSNMKIIGTPDALPYTESFANGKNHTFWAEDHTGKGRWNPLDHGKNKYVHDGDCGTYAYSGGDDGDSSIGMTGRINIEDTTNPVLSFWYMPIGTIEDEVTVEVATDEDDFKVVKQLDVATDEVMEKYTKVVLPLSEFKSAKNIQIGFRETNASRSSIIYIDDIRLYDQMQNDLAATIDSLPNNLRADEPRYACIKVANYGENAVSGADYNVSFVAGGKTIGKVEGCDIKSGESALLNIALNTDITLTGDSVDVYAYVDYAADEMTNNNSSDIAKLRLISSTYPCPETLTATDGGNKVLLKWDAPSLPTLISQQTTDGFEDAPDFTISNWGDWTLVDRNKNMVYGIDGVDYPNACAPQAFTIFNQKEANADKAWAAYSGNKAAVAFSTTGQTDHWLISPELSREEQTVEFFAHQYSTQYIEKFEVMYSDKSSNTEDFKLLEKYTSSTTDNSWKDYSVELPAGSKYFAIHYTSYDGFAMLFDDFTFTTVKSGNPNISLVGYNVYRDGQKLNATPLATNEYTDVPETGTHSYAVTAVYDYGESYLSETANIEIVTAISNIAADSTHNSAVFDLNGRHIAEPQHGVFIVNGKKIVKK